MTTQRRKLITIVTEAALEAELCEAIEKLGASGFTLVNARGSGSRGIRDAGWSSSGNIRVEVVCSVEVAQRITHHLQENYYDNYAMILFESDVTVLRPEKFG